MSEVIALELGLNAPDWIRVLSFAIALSIIIYIWYRVDKKAIKKGKEK